MKKQEIYITHMLALCYMYKDFEKFKLDLEKTLTKSWKIDFAGSLKKVSCKEYIFNPKLEKSFYSEHKFLIDVINKFTSIKTFIFLNFDCYGRLEPKSSLNHFYKYILDNEKDLDKIIKNLYKLKELGFNKFEFQDFIPNYYSVSKYSDNNNIVYLENMEAIPVANSKEILYKSDSSKYKIIIETQDGKDRAKIILNDLTFGVDRLPDSINKELLLNQIKNLDSSITKEKEVIGDAVLISDSIYYLSCVYEYALEKISETHDEDFKTKLIEILEQVNIKINELKMMNNTHNVELTEQYDNIHIQNIYNGIDDLRRNRKKLNKD